MNLKNKLPFENYTLITKLSIEDVCKRISENIEPKKTAIFSFLSCNSTKPYEGELVGDSFNISRIINYRNSFLPIIKGQITTSLGQTQIKIKMRPATFVLIFISIWLGIVGLFCIGFLAAGILQILRHGFSPIELFVLFPFGMFLLGYLLTFFAFKSESKKSKEFLARLLEGQEI